MKRLDITASGVEEAKILALEQGITVIHDATRMWRSQGKPIFDRQIKVFAANVLTKLRYWGFEGAGIIIALDEGKTNVKKHPTKIVNYIRKGRCKLKRVIEIRSKQSDEVYGTAPTKKEAYKVAKEIAAAKREDVYAKTRYEATDIDFDCLFSPTKGYKIGSYVVFGVEFNDAELYKKKLHMK